MDIITVNGKDMEREAGERHIDALLTTGKNVRVTYPDGAAWLYRADGRSIKLNDA